MSADDVVAAVVLMDSERLPLLGPPCLYLANGALVGAPSNHCLDASMTLAAAYGVLGIEAMPAPVQLYAPDEHGKPTGYGSAEPHFEDDQLVGHVGVWLPQMRRFIDATAQQFPGLRTTNPSPVCLPADRDWSALVGAEVWAQCASVQIMYRPLEMALLDEIVRYNSDRVDGGHYRAGVNLASQFLQFMVGVPELATRIRDGSHHPRVRELVGYLDGAGFEVDDAGDYLISPAGRAGVGAYLDQLSPAA